MKQNSTKPIRSNIRTVPALAATGITMVLKVIISVFMVESINGVGDGCSFIVDVSICMLVAVGTDTIIISYHML